MTFTTAEFDAAADSDCGSRSCVLARRGRNHELVRSHQRENAILGRKHARLAGTPQIEEKIAGMRIASRRARFFK